MAFQGVTVMSLLYYLFKAITPVTLSGVEVALWIGNPTEDLSGGAEVTGNGYARVTTGSGDWSSPVDSVNNTSAITFPEAVGGDWGTVTHIVLATLLTGSPAGGFYGPLLDEKEIAEGSIPRFAPGDLSILLI